MKGDQPLAMLAAVVLAIVAIGALGLCAGGGEAAATTHDFSYEAGGVHATPIVTVGILSDGVPLTSANFTPADQDGIHRFPSHAIYGFPITIVWIDANGLVSAPSNAQTWGGCDWDHDGDGMVTIFDFAIYREEYGDGSADLVEQDSFNAAFGTAGCE